MKYFGKREGLDILIVHGEKESCEAERTSLIAAGHKEDNVNVMEFGKGYEI